jgi:hypothetical protein
MMYCVEHWRCHLEVMCIGSIPCPTSDLVTRTVLYCNVYSTAVRVAGLSWCYKMARVVIELHQIRSSGLSRKLRRAP